MRTSLLNQATRISFLPIGPPQPFSIFDHWQDVTLSKKKKKERKKERKTEREREIDGHFGNLK